MRTVWLLLVLQLTVVVPCLSQKTQTARTLRAVYLQDVDGDGRSDSFVYEVRSAKNNYEGSLIITSATKRILWEHRWRMHKSDLTELVQTEGEVTGKTVNLQSWVKEFFTGRLNYGAKFERARLKESDLRDEERLTAFAKYYHTSLVELRKSILSQNPNVLFSYRAEWREDLNLLVYAPSIGKFICYRRGY
jgi:hypothetical protein